jgi:SAM-dependent methyltransferase
MSPKATERFSDRVADYVRARPAYPEAFYTFLRVDLELTAGKAVADVGSGTGISARPLVEQGVVVYGVEPNAPMREAAEAGLGAFGEFRSVDGTAEATTLAGASVDVVLAAQAFHWFDKGRARAEFARILRPGGWVVLVWNERRLDSTPFLRGYEALLQTFATDYRQVRHENASADVIRAFFAPAEVRVREFANAQQFDYAGLEARLLSSSYTPGADHPGRAGMLAELRRLFDAEQRGGRVAFEYDTRAWYGRLGGA